jgi:hypothetical protein
VVVVACSEDGRMTSWRTPMDVEDALAAGVDLGVMGAPPREGGGWMGFHNATTMSWPGAQVGLRWRGERD